MHANRTRTSLFRENGKYNANREGKSKKVKGKKKGKPI
jgi:hypothetical protein